MSAEDVIESQPIQLLKGDHGLPKQGLSLLVARHGVGKTAALVNFALESILDGGKVIHYTVGMTSEKTHNYYQEIFNEYCKTHPDAQSTTWAEIYSKFLVVSYMDAEKMVHDLESETKTITQGASLKPTLIIADGLDFNEQADAMLAQLKTAAEHLGVPLIASMILHRTNGGSLDLDGPITAAKAHTHHMLVLEPMSDSARIKVEFIQPNTRRELPFYFCPNDLIFRT